MLLHIMGTIYRFHASKLLHYQCMKCYANTQNAGSWRLADGTAIVMASTVSAHVMQKRECPLGTRVEEERYG